MANIIDRAVDSFKKVGDGLKTVFMHTFKEPTTQEYPEDTPDLAAHFRGRLALTVNPDTGDHLCISCRQCERVCPDKCIEITAHKSPETNKLELIDFKIDHGLCMFCGLCTEVCPTQCIINTNDFEMADYTRESLVYDIKRLTLTQDESTYYFDKKEMPKPKPKPAAKPAAGAAAAKPAAGAAAAKPAAGAAAAKPAAGADAKTESKESKDVSTEAKETKEAKVEAKDDKADLKETKVEAKDSESAKADSKEAKADDTKGSDEPKSKAKVENDSDEDKKEDKK